MCACLAQIWTSDWFRDAVTIDRTTYPPTATGPGLPPADAETLMAPLTSLRDRLAILRRLAAIAFNRTVRVLLAGLTRTGKTSLVRSAQGTNPLKAIDDGTRTQGVEVHRLPIAPMSADNTPEAEATAVVFDFGGHFEYYPVRAQFLHRDCFVVVTFSIADAVAGRPFRGAVEAACEEVMLWVSGVAGEVAGDRRVGVVVVGTHVDEAVSSGAMTVSLGMEKAGVLVCAVCC